MPNPTTSAKEKTTVIIPAWNEEKYIADVLKPAIAWKREDPEHREVVVVNDGSTDKTAEIARKMGAKVIPSDSIRGRHLGKGQAFVAGAKEAKQNGSTVLISFDADLTSVTPKKINTMVSELQKRNLDMVVVKSIEGKGQREHYETTFSGQRAFKISALEPLLKGKGKWTEPIKRYGLEKGLEKLIKKVGCASSIVFHAAPVGRRIQFSEHQFADMRRAGVLFKKREELAAELRAIRSQGKMQEARALLARQKAKHRIFR